MSNVSSLEAARRRAGAAERQRKARFKRQMRELGYRFVETPIAREAIGALAAYGVLSYETVEDDDRLAIEACEIWGRLAELIAEHPDLADALRRESR